MQTNLGNNQDSKFTAKLLDALEHQSPTIRLSAAKVFFSFFLYVVY